MSMGDKIYLCKYYCIFIKEFWVFLNNWILFFMIIFKEKKFGFVDYGFIYFNFKLKFIKRKWMIVGGIYV